MESLSPINDSARDLLNLGRKISLESGDDREASFFVSTTVYSDSAVY